MAIDIGHELQPNVLTKTMILKKRHMGSFRTHTLLDASFFSYIKVFSSNLIWYGYRFLFSFQLGIPRPHMYASTRHYTLGHCKIFSRPPWVEVREAYEVLMCFPCKVNK